MIHKKYPCSLNLMVVGLCVILVGRVAASLLIFLMLQRGIEYLDEDKPPPLVTAAPRQAPAPELTELERAIAEGVRCRGNRCEVDRSVVDKVLANTSDLARSARFVPSLRDHKPDGFKVYAIRPGSIYAKLGLQSGDLIKSINDLDLATPDKALEAYVKLKPASHLTLLLERRGENMTREYQIR